MAKTQIPGLTSCRGIAAISVMITHILLLQYFPIDTFSYKIIAPWANLGMSLFFCLSGVVIHYNYYDRIKAKPARETYLFLVARLARLAPLYIIAVIFCYLFSVVWFYIHNAPQKTMELNYILLTWLAGMQSWWYAGSGSANIFSVFWGAGGLWSISTEILMYIFYLLMINKIALSKRTSCFVVLAIGIIGRLICAIITDTGHLQQLYEKVMGDTSIYSYNFGYWFIYFSPYSRFFEFLCGVGLADFICKYEFTKKIKQYCFIGLLASLMCYFTVYLAVLMYPTFSVRWMWIHFFSSIIAIFVILIAFSSMFAIFQNTILVFLGEISYSIYLIHIILFTYMRPVIDKYSIPVACAYPALVTLTFVLSHLSYKFVEVPSRRYLRAKLQKVLE